MTLKTSALSMLFQVELPLLRRAAPLLAILAVLAVAPVLAEEPDQGGPTTLEQQLLARPAGEWVAAARQDGDPIRGAIVFFQHHMACSKCHSVGAGQPSTLGPDLALLPPETTDESLVESVLAPSKAIRKGFEAVSVALVDGRSLVGLLVSKSPEKIVLRDVARGGELTTLDAAQVEEVEASPLSIMPAGQVNQLASPQQFLDLVRYLIEVRAGGAARARELQPSPALLTFAIPEYEQHLDHAGLIGDWNAEALKRGAAIYERVCANCHGTRDRPGSLPTSLRFAEGKFKNGSDPLAMYQTLTRGFGLMAPQTWMAPVQKYDVIHYIRETYLRQHNPTQFVAVDAAYLARLPKGDTRGPEPSTIEPWSAMDYGPSLTHTLEIPGWRHNFAYKGVAVRLDPGAGGVSRGRHWMVFDTDTLRVAAAWSAGDKGPGFIDWRDIQFNGQHNIHPKVIGDVAVVNPTGPGWADPASGSWRDDQRVLGRDQLRYGPLPRAWARYRGLYHHGQQVILSYSIGDAAVLELPRIADRDGPPVFLRTFNIGPRPHPLTLLVATQPSEAAFVKVAGASGVVTYGLAAGKGGAEAQDMPETKGEAGTKGKAEIKGKPETKAKPHTVVAPITAGVAPEIAALTWTAAEGRLMLQIPPGVEPLAFTVWTKAGSLAAAETALPVVPLPQLDLEPLTHGGPPRWPQKLETQAVLGPNGGPFATDVLTSPEPNPWLAQMRFTGLDFWSDGRVAACTWDGDVWVIEGPPNRAALRWQRIATGLYQPLGLKVLKDKVHVLCRDQLAVLHDLNGDGETDFYECLNNDHQVTEHFHEFAMGLQTDGDGNFYYAKSGRHALPAIVPHHGTLLRITPDGSRTDILATGFRAANGVCLNPDGSFVVTDQEGFWNPKNRLNWVAYEPGRPLKFYGNMFGYTDVTDTADSAMEPPLCWITNAFDRSPAELLWVDSPRWGQLEGSLLNLSYGYGKVFLVPHERVAGKMQGGMIALPIADFPTGVMRGRFHPGDGELYLCGMFAWAGKATQPGGLYRLRATGRPMRMPKALQATKTGLRLTFTDPLDARSIDASAVQIRTWGLKRTARYGSAHHDEKPLSIRRAALLEDGQTVLLETPDIQPTWCMEIKYNFRAADGTPLSGVIHNTIHALGE